jgi:hypothetical protein
MTYEKADEILSENRRLREEVAQLKFDVHQLEVMLRLKHLSQFAPSSERYISSPLFPGTQRDGQEVEKEESTEIKGHIRRKKKRPVIPDNAPREIVRHDLPESERICPVDGEKLTQGIDRKCLQVEWIPAKNQSDRASVSDLLLSGLRSSSQSR